MVGTHFNDGHFILLLYGQQAEWHPNVVVQIPCRCPALETRTQYSMEKLLGGGLSIASRQTDDRNVEPFPMVSGKVLESLQSIFSDQYAFVLNASIFIHDHERRLFFEHLGNKVIGIEAISTHCKKNITSCHLT